jgi:hypothetical protein
MKLCKILNKSYEELNKKAVEKKNRAMENRFAAVPFSKRVVFVPHCMRNIEKCKAKEMGSYYICAECGACKIGPISKKMKSLGYKALYILKGGKAMDKLTKETEPGAILGVACYYEGVLGMKECEKHKIPVQFVSLTKDGCSGTDVNLEEVLEAIQKSS